MKLKLILCILLILVFGCEFENSKQTYLQPKENTDDCILSSEIKWDSTDIEDDSTIYDSRLQISPFIAEDIDLFEKEADSVHLQMLQVNDIDYTLKKIYNNNSYIIFVESPKYGKSLLEAYILDPSISLANHIKIGDKKQDLEIYYHRNIKSKTIFIIDESEFTEIKIHLKEQKIVKITFICYEIENQLGLL